MCFGSRFYGVYEVSCMCWLFKKITNYILLRFCRSFIVMLNKTLFMDMIFDFSYSCNSSVYSFSISIVKCNVLS